jgi:hypothetical protein
MAAAGDDRGGVRRRLARAQQLHDAGRLAEAHDLVVGVVADVDDAPPDSVSRRYRSKAHGLLGMVLYRLKDLAGAEEHTLLALEAGREEGDEAAMVIYPANLDVLRRD